MCMAQNVDVQNTCSMKMQMISMDKLIFLSYNVLMKGIIKFETSSNQILKELKKYEILL